MHRVCEARIWRTLAFEAREGWQRSQGHDEGHTITIGTCSPDHVHQKCPEDGAGVSRVVYHVDLVCWDHEASEEGSQHNRGGVVVVMCQKDTPDSAVDCRRPSRWL